MPSRGRQYCSALAAMVAEQLFSESKVSGNKVECKQFISQAGMKTILLCTAPARSLAVQSSASANRLRGKGTDWFETGCSIGARCERVSSREDDGSGVISELYPRIYSVYDKRCENKRRSNDSLVRGA